MCGVEGDLMRKQNSKVRWPWIPFCLGIGMIAIPLIGGVWQQGVYSQIAETYQQEMEALDDKEEERMWQAAQNQPQKASAMSEMQQKRLKRI